MSTFLISDAFGQTLRETEVEISLPDQIVIRSTVEEGFYYVLYSSEDLEGFETFRDIALPEENSDLGKIIVQLVDDIDFELITQFYEIKEIPGDQARDLDFDGMDDYYELTHSAALNPLDPTDPDLDYDNDGRSNLQEYLDLSNPLIVDVPNLPLPVFEATADQTVTLGQSLSFEVSATDPDGVALRFSVSPSPLPERASFNSLTGLFEWRPTSEQVGDHVFTFLASNGLYTAEEEVTISVETNANGETALSGIVLSEGGAPLQGVGIGIGQRAILTGADGRFIFRNLQESGLTRVLFDGGIVSEDQGVFATVPEKIDIQPGGANELPAPVILLPLDVESGDPVVASQTSVVTSSPLEVEGVGEVEITLTIPPNTAFYDEGPNAGQLYEGDIHITPLPDPNQAPQPLPEDMELSIYVAVQPFGVSYSVPAPISFPNVENFPAGSVVDIVAINHDTGQLEIVGQGQVSGDGRTVDSIGGVVTHNSWHGFIPQGPIADGSPTPEMSPVPPTPPLPERKPDYPPSEKPDPCPAPASASPGSRFLWATGEFYEDHIIPAYRSMGQSRALHFVYKSSSAYLKALVSTDSLIGNQTPPPKSIASTVTVAGIEMAAKSFAEPNLVLNTFQQYLPARTSRLVDVSSLPTGAHAFEFDIDCIFEGSRRSDVVAGKVIVQNEIDSSFGAGWTLVGLEKVCVNPDGSAVVCAGDGGATLYEAPDESGEFVTPAGAYSVLKRLVDDSFEKRTMYGETIKYRSDGLMTARVDRNGNETKYTYDSLSRLTTVEDPMGLKTQLSYAGNGKLSRVVDPANRETLFTHDRRGNLVGIRNPNGTERTFSYDENRLLVGQIDELDQETSYEYDGAGRIQRAISKDGTVHGLQAQHVGTVADFSALGTDEEPQPVPPLVRDIGATYTNPGGNQTRIETDSFGATVKTTDPIGRIVEYSRDENSNPTSLTRPNGSIQNRTYDDFGNVLSLTETSNGAETAFAYDPNFNLITSITDPLDETATITRDEFGNAMVVENALGHRTILEYDEFGFPIRIEDPNGLVTEIVYNSYCLPEKVTQIPPVGEPRVALYEYDAAGQLTKSTSPGGVVSKFEYTIEGWLNATEDGLGQRYEAEYDSRGNLISRSVLDADGTIVWYSSTEYDDLDRVVKNSAPADEESKTLFAYDEKSNLVGTNDPNGNAAYSVYDEADRIREFVDRTGGITEYDYDNLNNVTRLISPNGVSTYFEYDELGRMVLEDSPDRGIRTTIYDLDDKVISLTDGRGVRTGYEYDALSRMTMVSYPGGEENVVMIYDQGEFGVGRLSSREEETGTYNFKYDPFGNLVEEVFVTAENEFVTQYEYNADNQVTAITYPSSRRIEYDYDDIGRVSDVRAQVNGQMNIIIEDIKYRADNLLISRKFGNGLLEIRSYDSQGRLEIQELENLESRSYAYDRNSNLVVRGLIEQSESHVYDAEDRLTLSQVGDLAQQFSYDLNGNRLAYSLSDEFEERYNYESGSNRLLGVSAFGSLDSELADSRNIEFTYNEAGRLRSVSRMNSWLASYYYNFYGLRVRKELEGDVIDYLHNRAGNIIVERYQSGSASKELVWIGVEPVFQIDHSNGEEIGTFIHSDGFLAPRLATNENSDVVWQWNADAFGVEEPESGSSDPKVDLRFPGQYFDSETNLVYNWLRFYDRFRGRYLSPDSLGVLLEEGSGYSYAGSNPLTFIDPDGAKKRNIRSGLVNAGKAILEVPQTIVAGSMHLVVSLSNPKSAGTMVFNDIMTSGTDTAFIIPPKPTDVLGIASVKTRSNLDESATRLGTLIGRAYNDFTGRYQPEEREDIEKTLRNLQDIDSQLRGLNNRIDCDKDLSAAEKANIEYDRTRLRNHAALLERYLREKYRLP